MEYTCIKDFVKEQSSNLKAFNEALKSLVNQTENDNEFNMLSTGTKILYQCNISDISINDYLQVSDIIEYIKDNKIGKKDYETAILECVKKDIEDKIWS